MGKKDRHNPPPRMHTPAPPANYNIGVYPGYPAQPAQQPAYSAQQPQLVQTMQPVVVVQQMPTEGPGRLTCPRCQVSVLTKIKYRNGHLNWAVCMILGMFLCWPFCFIPFCVNRCKDVVHCCPMCDTILHVYQRK